MNGQTSITVGSYTRIQSGYSTTNTKRYQITGVKKDGTSGTVVTRTSTHSTPITYNISDYAIITLSNQILGTMGSNANYETYYMRDIVIE